MNRLTSLLLPLPSCCGDIPAAAVGDVTTVVGDVIAAVDDVGPPFFWSWGIPLVEMLAKVSASSRLIPLQSLKKRER